MFGGLSSISRTSGKSRGIRGPDTLSGGNREIPNCALLREFIVRIFGSRRYRAPQKVVGQFWALFRRLWVIAKFPIATYFASLSLETNGYSEWIVAVVPGLSKTAYFA